MVRLAPKARFGPGLHAPARLLLAAAIVLAPAPLYAQAPAANPAATTLPDPLTVSKMIWSVMAAVDHANVTGNYSVLRDLGAPSFQSNNNAASLAGVFQAFRDRRIDIGNTLVVTPSYDIPPTLIEGRLMRVRGVFPLRPDAIAFDLLFQPHNGRWLLFGISVAPVAPAPARR